jgi:serine/threonine-protein kinase ATR
MASAQPARAAGKKPLMRDFIGLNTHTVQFRPELYKPVTRLLRDYHPVDWDLGSNPANPTKFPMTYNGVNWRDLYGEWVRKGFKINATAQFESIPIEKWQDIPKESFAYGEAFARFFGPSGSNRLVESVEVGNEPEKWPDDKYQAMMRGMASGLRKGDPRLLISTCAVAKGSHDRWSRDVANLKGMERLYDVLNVHTYAFKEGWPTWRRSHPEDPTIGYLKQVRDVIDWRNANVPGKKLWVTEFGWDASTQKPPVEGDAAKWVGSTDTEQARYIVRAYLDFSSMDIDRAYLFWFNDEDKPSLHAASGLTRNYQPKPSYHAVAHLFKTLGDYRFERALAKRPNDVYAYQYGHETRRGHRVVAVWSPTGSERQSEVDLAVPKGKIVRAERMPLTGGAVETVPFKVERGKVRLRIDESPVYLWIQGG